MASQGEAWRSRQQKGKSMTDERDINALRHYVARLEYDLVEEERQHGRTIVTLVNAREHIRKQALDIVTLGQEVGRLREALEPFANAGKLFGDRGEYTDMTIYLPAAGEQYQIVGDDLRRARAALAEKDEK